MKLKCLSQNVNVLKRALLLLVVGFIIHPLNAAVAFAEDSSNTILEANIIRVQTDFPEKEGWVRIPKGTKKMSIYVEAEHTDTVLFWYMPTGTETWYDRRLIGYAINTHEDDSFTITWDFDDFDPNELLGHIHIQAIGINNIDNEGFNIAPKEGTKK